MSRTRWITLLVVGTCAAFVIGVVIGGIKKPQVRYRQISVKPEVEKPESEGLLLTIRALRIRLKDYREKLAEVRRKWLPPPSSEERERYSEFMQWKEERKRAEREQALFEEARALRRKIVQRRDEAMREEGLAKLTALIQSNNPEELALGLTSLLHLDGLKVGVERFKPQILAAVGNESPEVRNAALNCIGTVCGEEEALSVVLGMVNDPSPEVRASTIFNLRLLNEERPAEEVETALTSLLYDEDETVRKRALLVLSDMYEVHEAEEDEGDAGRAEEIRPDKLENLASELSGDLERASEVLRWWESRAKFRAEDVQRLAEMMLEGEIQLFGSGGYSDRSLTLLLPDCYPYIDRVEEESLLMRRFCVQLLRRTVDDGLRYRALEILRQSGKSSIAELEEILRNGRAAGMENEVTEVIGYLRTGRERLPSLGKGEEEEAVEEEEEWE